MSNNIKVEDKNINIKVKVWRQRDAQSQGAFETYETSLKVALS